jgi:hypothetical protein
MKLFSKPGLRIAMLLIALPSLQACVYDEEEIDLRPQNYGGSASHPIKVINGKATVAKCGEWKENLGADQQNRLNPNHGCSVQHNVAAMIADPSDMNAKPNLGRRNSALDVAAVQSTQSSRRSGGLFDLFGE